LVNTLNGTGIVAAPYIRTAGEVKLTKTITAVQNVVGIVVCMGELVKTSNQLPKRLVSLQFADYEFGIEFVGAIASCPPRIGDEILVVPVKMVSTYRRWRHQD